MSTRAQPPSADIERETQREVTFRHTGAELRQQYPRHRITNPESPGIFRGVREVLPNDKVVVTKGEHTGKTGSVSRYLQIGDNGPRVSINLDAGGEIETVTSKVSLAPAADTEAKWAPGISRRFATWSPPAMLLWSATRNWGSPPFTIGRPAARQLTMGLARSPPPVYNPSQIRKIVAEYLQLHESNDSKFPFYEFLKKKLEIEGYWKKIGLA